MEIQITNNGKMGIIQKIILVLFGIFITAFLFAMIIRIFGEETHSLWIGAITTSLLAGSAITFIKNKSLKLIAYGMATTVIIGIIGILAIVQIATKMLEGL